ncbi:hypothetical protein IKG07_02840, partial [Candidatus Saccharibacteria bacterium]|nr:hypothetical protein [Candidatus Saccharibacteria bacterium]
TYTQSSFTADKWGYKINSNTSIPSTITSGYVPFVSGNTLMESDTAVNHDEAELSLAAKIDYLQASGSYSTTLNFNIVAHPLVDYIQDFTPTMCRTLASASDYTVVDKRDGNDYTVRWINGNCWMTEDLRFIGKTNDPAGTMTLDSTTSNVDSVYTVANPQTISYADVTTSASYDAARIHVGVNGSGDSTVWYNFAAVSAMTITGSSNTADAVYDICPKGWRLPNSSEQTSVTSYSGAYSPTTGGFYSGTSMILPGEGYWWASTYGGTIDRYFMRWTGSSLTTSYDGHRNNSVYTRCIMQPQTMQSFTNTDAGAMGTNEVRTLRDARDNQEYTVTKLSDGNVWMTRNLAIGCNGVGSTYGDTITSKNLTPSDSNIASNWSTPTASLTSGNTYDEARMACNTTYGAWYNYAAVSAGTILGSSNSDAQVYDICPKGWRLPTNIEQSNILSYTSNFLAVTGGRYREGGRINTSYGYWWAATPSDITGVTVYRYVLQYYNNSLSINDSNRYSGNYIRCLKDDPRTIADISTMQEISSQIVAKMNDGDTATLEDSRDGQEYTVAKINGNLWMTRNLAIGCNGLGSTYGSTIIPIELTPDNTNISFNYTTPTTVADSGYDVIIPRMSCSGTYGAWYNIVATSAGTITGQSPTNYTFWATENICPAGWTLPNITQANGISSSTPYYNLYLPTLGGFYYNGSYDRETVAGYWWVNTTTIRNCLGYNSGATYVTSSCSNTLDGAIYVRCVAK